MSISFTIFLFVPLPLKLHELWFPYGYPGDPWAQLMLENLFENNAFLELDEGYKWDKVLTEHTQNILLCSSNGGGISAKSITPSGAQFVPR